MRVLLADDHHLSRRGLRAILEADGITVVGEALTQTGAINAASSTAPDVVVLEPRMVGSVTEAIRRILDLGPEIRVVILTASADGSEVRESLAAGATGYLLKDTSGENLLAAIRRAAAGQAVLSGEAMRALAAELPRTTRAAGDAATVQPNLSDREREILRMIVEGASNATIGRALSISPHTVKQHVSNICEALGVNGRVQAAVRAVRDGLL